MQDLPSIRSYGKYSSGNYGVNSLRVDVGNVTLYFSYKTVVAFRAPGYSLTVSENIWGPTTGKHLNWIDDGDKGSRLPRDKFEDVLRAALASQGLQEAD